MFRSILLFFLGTSSLFAQQTVGLFLNDSLSYNGYTLFSPTSSHETFLIDNCGRLVHSWTSAFAPGSSVYLLENGNLLRTARVGSTFSAGGSGGRIELYDWSGDLLWGYTHSSSTYHQHHDIAPLPNGNILILAWELHEEADAILAGRDPVLVGNQGVWSEQIIEVQPVGTDQVNIVWEWHLWDHLVQDIDSSLSNYGIISDHPELMNLNYGANPGSSPDWIHANAIDYHPSLDQIVYSSRHLNEIYVIDHSTTSAEAASHTGGNSGKGGDFLYRWGNPAAYNRGLVTDQQFFGQHDVNWIPDSLQDGGKIMVYNNGLSRPEGNYSSVDVISPPIDGAGNYLLNLGQAYGPDSASWSYTSQPPNTMFSSRISGARRLANGNTLICEGASGRFLEVSYEGKLVWEYINPIRFGNPVNQGMQISQNDVFRATRLGENYPAFVDKELIPGEPIELNPLASSCVIYSDSDSIPSDTTVIDTMTTNIVSEYILQGTKIYPNPFSSDLFIHHRSLEDIEMSILDSRGQILEKKIVKEQHSHISTRLWPRGVYMIRLSTKDRLATHKLLKL